MATAVVKVIKKEYPNSNIIVVSPFPDVFLNNPYVYKTYNLNSVNGIWEKYIKNKKTKIFVSEPYTHNDFLLEEPKHLLETWCKLYDLQYRNETPQIYLAKPEIDYFKPYYKNDKPIFVIQPNGGPEGLPYQYSWTRDIPKPNVEEIIEHYKNDYTIIHIKRKDQIIYPDTLQALDGFRSIAILLQLSKKRLLIDSFGQHFGFRFKSKLHCLLDFYLNLKYLVMIYMII